MPYAGVDEKDVPRLDECVKKVMAEGHSKSSAIAICRSSMNLAEADDEAPPDISTPAKLALALQVLATVERVHGAAKDAPDGMSADELADSLTAADGANVAGSLSNLFEGTHITNITSNATAALRNRLEDPKFRAAYPYVMIVSTNPDARMGHKLLDGFVISSEEARYSHLLPPYDFGCDCTVVPISAAEAKAHGLTGAAPLGDVNHYLRGKGVEMNRYGSHTLPGGAEVHVGVAPGFHPPMQGTDAHVQLGALREKAHEILQEDPEDYGALSAWLITLFGYNVLLENPPRDEME